MVYHIKILSIEKTLFFVVFFLFSISCHHSQESKDEFNFGFEVVENGLPKGWFKWGHPNYCFIVDSLVKHSGKYSLLIESTDTSDIQGFGCPVLFIPSIYEGDSITLEAFMRTEGVEQPIGLMLRIDGNSSSLQFDNMIHKGITGSGKWEKYSVTLPFPREAKRICIGAILSGKGKLWIDDFQVMIDNTDIKNAKVHNQKHLLAEKKDSEVYHQTQFLYDKDTAFLSCDTLSHSLMDKLFSYEDKTLITNLELLCKLWGFLKYHHPVVCTGKYNWDKELITMLPEYLEVNRYSERDEILLKWIKKYGEIPKCEICEEVSSDAVLKPDLSWVDHYNMSTTLKYKIEEIYRNRHQGEQFYVKMSNSGNPVFSNENNYSSIRYIDARLRIVALFRYWNMIEYFFPYRHLTDKNWNAVLKEYIPKFIMAKTELEYELTILLLVGEINDSHAVLQGGNKIDSLRGGWQAPFQVRFIENNLVVTDYYKPEIEEIVGLSAGDIITHINRKNITTLIDSIKFYYPASNEVVKMKKMADDLLRSNDNTMMINYISTDNVEQEMELMLYERKDLDMIKKNDNTSYKFLNDNYITTELIGYITLGSINRGDIDKIKRSFKRTKGIVIDVRNYPSTFVPFLLGSFFVSDNTPFVKFSVGNLNNPGEFTFLPTLEITKSEDTYFGKVVVLVNEETISQSEYTAMAFRAGANTTIIGSQTAGADGNVSEIIFPGGLRTWISGIGIYYPDGRETQRIGIVPDVEVKPTIQGIREGRDELLEKAIDIIKQN